MLSITTNRGVVSVPVGGANRAARVQRGAAIEFFIPAVLGDVLPGSAAMRGGLRAGDSIVAIDHLPVQSWSQLQELVTPSAGKDLPFEIRRGRRQLRR